MKLRSGYGTTLVEISNTPIIFLDIDGVLNSSIAHYHSPGEDKLFFGGDWVSKSILKGFQDFIYPSPIMIVGISSWFSVSREEENVKIMAGLGLLERFLGTTDFTGGGQSRGNSVLRYVEKHNLKHWCVLDDAGGMMFQYPTVITNGRIGLTRQDLNSISYMLEFSPDLELCKTLQNYKV
ncbi:Sir2 (NAD-dependent deacetylase) [Yersinia phage phiR2-01]|uniref:RNA repair protein n=1 Tax=Yersinia phage phiR2-01 TaxID=1206557 RepID=I7KQW2_9CAUD|nr:Sir2 (NAD-dependent deacetylase) [Yersinia phage phiR2-01]CCI88525.1 hypothetical protein BN79_116 [Yersinia phage phiR2-01]